MATKKQRKQRKQFVRALKETPLERFDRELDELLTNPRNVYEEAVVKSLSASPMRIMMLVSMRQQHVETGATALQIYEEAIAKLGAELQGRAKKELAKRQKKR